ncbi:MAG: penicillin-binding protein 2 [Candidatus Omnitrophica bacterium]|nr:penicillin-binding protein 2 [Candidatus Omnitrophota bacterium]MBL7210197.1 penicillin-binding protein 2 [Candidatus Omnitrophota bacterium]
MNRIRFVRISVVLLFVILILGLFNLQVIRGRKFKGLSDKNCIRLLPQSGARGEILDRNGRPIAGNKLSYDLMLLPQEPVLLERAINGVARVLRSDPQAIKKAFRNNYVASSVPVLIAKNIGIKDAIALEELKFDTPGIIIQLKPTRYYPYGSLACHILGYLGEIDRWRLTKLANYGYKTKDIVGFGGVEEAYDYYLRQEEGGVSFEVDHRGRLVRLLGFRPPRNGKDIRLTLDINLQKIAEDKLSGRKGCVIIMDPYSGEVSAMVSSPGFSPSLFVDNAGTEISALFNNPDAPFVNRAISGLYPAGSVFKAVVACAGMETGKVTDSTAFFCEGSLVIGGKEFACWGRHGLQDLTAAIAHSCNIFFYKTGLLCGAGVIHDYALRFGMNRPTSIEIPYEASGFVPSPLRRKINKFRNWYDGDTANFSIGQGELLVTPLQITRMMAVFANGGSLVSPYLAKEIGDRDISVYRRRPKKINIKANTIEHIRKGLRSAVSDEGGTVHVLSGLSVPVAGKTGTAQVAGRRSHAWFAGFFPYEKPKFVICVFLEHGGSGLTSCVLAKRIIQTMAEQGLI